MRAQAIRLEVYGRTDVGRVRSKNEDAFVVADLMADGPVHGMARPLELALGARGVLLAVSDGMGGAQSGEVASALALHALRRGMTAEVGSAAETALSTSVEQANRRVWDTAIRSGRKGMGATLTAVLIEGNRAFVAEVGDSRAYLLRGRKFLQLTHDQSCAQLLIDAGSLRPEELSTFPFRNVIMQAIGTKPDVVVALNRLTLRRGDRILLCSDGLTGKIGDDELRRMLLSGGPLDATVLSLVELANARGGEDNITALLAELSGDGLPLSTSDDRVSLETVQAFHG
jgi:serine/threonine protein phosphatase PrpC